MKLLRRRQNDSSRYFIEDLDHISVDSEELEAVKWALDSLIAEEIWKASGLNHHSTYFDVITFARSLRISPSIPAGRIRRESGDYKAFNTLIGNKKVRLLFNMGSAI